MHFFHAELLYRMSQFQRAHDEYSAAQLADPHGKWAEASAEEAARSADEVVKDRDRLKPVPPLANKDPVPLPALDAQLVDACEHYRSSYPAGKLAVECEYKVARVYYRWNHFDASSPRFLMFLGAHPDAPRAAQVAALLLDTYAYLEDYEGLGAATGAIHGNPQLMANPDVKTLFITAEQ